MQISGTAEAAALVLTFLVHVIGAAILVWNMLDGSEWSWRDLWPDDGDDGDEPPARPESPRGGPDGIPLPEEARPARVRLREPGRISDGRPRPARRPEHAPEREPAREPERAGR